MSACSNLSPYAALLAKVLPLKTLSSWQRREDFGSHHADRLRKLLRLTSWAFCAAVDDRCARIEVAESKTDQMLSIIDSLTRRREIGRLLELDVVISNSTQRKALAIAISAAPPWLRLAITFSGGWITSRDLARVLEYAKGHEARITSFNIVPGVFSDVAISDHDVSAISSMQLSLRQLSVESTPSLRYPHIRFDTMARLSLSGCILLGDAAVTDIFSNCPMLQDVNLSGCESLRDPFLGGPALRDLNLEDCSQIVDICITRVFQNSPKIVSINLNGCFSVIEPYVASTSLRNLWFVINDRNWDESIEWWVETLRHCPSLAHVEARMLEKDFLVRAAFRFHC